MRRLTFLSLPLLCALPPARAQGFPRDTVRIIVTGLPGSGIDTLGRNLAQGLSQVLQQRVLVDNRAGGNGMIGVGQAARARPDGYTLLLTEGSALAIHVLQRKDPQLQPEQALQPLALVATTPNILVSHTASGPATLQALATQARSTPGRIDYGSPGVGTPQHLGVLQWSRAAGVQLKHIPYSGDNTLMGDVVTGQVPVAMAPLPATLPFVKTGRLRGLAIGSPQRSPLLPGVPTFQEAGLAGMVAELYYGAYLPAGTPADVAATLSRALGQVLADPKLRTLLAEHALNVEGSGSGSAALQARDRAETLRWRDLVQSPAFRD